MESYTPILTKSEPKDPCGPATRRRNVAPTTATMDPSGGPAAIDAPLVLFAVDNTGIVTLLEGKGLDLLNMPAAAHIGRSAFDLDNALSGLADLIRRGLNGESAVLSGHIGDRALDIWSSPIRDPNGVITGMIGVGIDTSVRRNLEHEAHHQERLAILGQVAGGIAHDFNNFLTTIMLYARLILSSDELSQNLRAAAETIMMESRRASDLIDQILRFSRRSAMKIQPIDLTWLVRNITRMLETTLPETIKLVTNLGTEAIIANADPTSVQQLLMNLAINARDAMPEGGTLQIDLTSRHFTPMDERPVPEMPCGEWIFLTVSDSGTGMTRDVLDHIYEPFFTTKGTGGTGLGLAQVQRIVQQHHGYIEVHSRVGEGSTFRVYLPGMAPDPTPVARPSLYAT
jgi:signal transduction histidine kinase